MENLDNARTSYNKLVERSRRLLLKTAVTSTARSLNVSERTSRTLDNDLNTSLAVTAVYDVLKSKTNAATKLALIDEFDKVLGLDLTANAKELAEQAASASSDIPSEVLELVEQRKAARKDKTSHSQTNFAAGSRNSATR